MVFDYDVEGNQLTLDQFNDLKVLAKMADADGSVRRLINLAFENKLNRGGRFDLMIPNPDSTSHLSEGKAKPKLRSLTSKCSVNLLECALSKPFDIISNIKFEIADGGSFEVKPGSQLGSYVYFITVDYAIQIIKLKLANSMSFPADLGNHQGLFQYRQLWFDNDLLSGTTDVVKHKVIVVNNHPVVTTHIDRHSTFGVSEDYETVDLILQSYDFASRMPNQIRKFRVRHNSSDSASGIVSTSGIGNCIIEDDDFGR